MTEEQSFGTNPAMEESCKDNTGAFSTLIKLADTQYEEPEVLQTIVEETRILVRYKEEPKPIPPKKYTKIYKIVDNKIVFDKTIPDGYMEC